MVNKGYVFFTKIEIKNENRAGPAGKSLTSKRKPL